MKILLANLLLLVFLIANLPAQQAASLPFESAQRATKTLAVLSKDKDPFIRANAIEASGVDDKLAKPYIEAGLKDKAAVVRYTALVVALKLKLNGLRDVVKPLINDEDLNVRAAAIATSYGLGGQVDISPLAQIAKQMGPGGRANVGMLLAELGEKSAVGLLHQISAWPMAKASAAEVAVCRIQLSASMAMLGEDKAIDALRAGVYSDHGEVRVIAILSLGELQDKKMMPAISRMLEKTAPEIRMASASALARNNDTSGLPVLMSFTKDEKALRRAQSAWGLRFYNDKTSLKRLETLIDDEAKQVQVSAVSSILSRIRDLANQKKR